VTSIRILFSKRLCRIDSQRLSPERFLSVKIIAETIEITPPGEGQSEIARMGYPTHIRLDNLRLRHWLPMHQQGAM
jgi:hypothetical protein